MAISFAVHALVGLVLFGVTHFSWPAPPIPIEILETKTTPLPSMSEPAKVEPRPAPRERIRKVASIKKSEPASEPAPKPEQPDAPLPKTENLAPFAPAGAKLVVLVRLPLLKDSPHRNAVDALLGALPDYDSLLGDTDLSLFDDFQALLIATSNPRDVTATFLAARYIESERVHSQIGSRALQPGDPRVFRFLGTGLAVLSRPEDAAILDEEDRDGGPPSWRSELGRFDQGAGAPALQVTLTSAPRLLRFGDGFPTPQGLSLAATGDPAPHVRVSATFASDAEASQFAARWPDVVARFRNQMILTGLGTVLDSFKLTQHGPQLELVGRVPELQMRIAFAWVTALLPPRAKVSSDGGIVPSNPPPAKVQ